MVRTSDCRLYRVCCLFVLQPSQMLADRNMQDNRRKEWAARTKREAEQAARRLIIDNNDSSGNRRSPRLKYKARPNYTE